MGDEMKQIVEALRETARAVGDAMIAASTASARRELACAEAMAAALCDDDAQVASAWRNYERAKVAYEKACIDLEFENGLHRENWRRYVKARAKERGIREEG